MSIFKITAIFLFLACLIGAMSPLSWAMATERDHDRLYLKNGDRLSGQFRYNTNQEIIFRPLYGALTQIPFTEIDYLHHRDGSIWRPHTGMVSDAEQSEIIAQQAAKTKKEDEEAKSFEPLGQGLESLFGVKTDGRLSLGMNKQTGNTDKAAVNFAARIRTRLSEKHRLTFGGEYKLTKDRKVRTEDRKNIYAIHDYFVNEKWFLSSNLKFETDEISDLELETTIGVGLGYQFFDRDDLTLSVTAGPSYIRRNFETAPTEETLAARWALDYEQQFFDDAFRLFHNHTILQGLDETDNFRFDSKTGLSIPLNKHLRAIGQIDYDYRGQVAPTAKRNDTKYSVNLGYEW